MSKTYATLGKALDKDNWDWLQIANDDIAKAVQAEVQAGADPEAIGRFMLHHIGPDRSALAARVVSAARWLETQRVSA